MSEKIDYTKFLPTEPPEGMIPFLKRQGKLSDECLVYRVAYVLNPLTGKKEKMVEVRCTACGEKYYQEYKKIESGCGRSYAPASFCFIHSETKEEVLPGNVSFCPCCCESVKVYHVGQINRTALLSCCYALSPYKFNDKFALLGWYIMKIVNKEGETRIISHPYEGYVYDGKKCTRVTGREQTFYSQWGFSEKWRQLSRNTDTWGSNSLQDIYEHENIMEYLQGTALENSKLDVYINTTKDLFPVSYLKLYLRHKNVENLIMQGAGHLVSEKIRERGNCYQTVWSSDIQGINWKERQPSKMIGLTKPEFKYVVKNRLIWSDIEFYLKYKENGVRLDDIKKCYGYGMYHFSDLVRYEKDVMKAIRYLDRQKRKYKTHASQIDLTELIDYWKMQKKNGVDISDSDIRYPQKLVSAHNAAVERLEFKQDTKLNKLFRKRFIELSKYMFEFGNLQIVPAKTERELFNEGKILHHCVSQYAKDHAKGETAIFFIRNKDVPNDPYFTLELNEKELTVRQNRGVRNCGRTADVKEFEEEWLKYIKSVKEKENEHGKSIAV